MILALNAEMMKMHRDNALSPEGKREEARRAYCREQLPAEREHAVCGGGTEREGEVTVADMEKIAAHPLAGNAALGSIFSAAMFGSDLSIVNCFDELMERSREIKQATWDQSRKC
ncbi:MAG: hypothetical protein U1E96_05820 [Azonexus sp.]